MSAMHQHLRKMAAYLLIMLLALMLSGSAMAKQTVTVEIFYSSAWHDVSTRWRVTKGEIVINHGAGNEQIGVIPSDASLTFDNRDGEMNPDNRRSSLFGLIGHNTPIRITVDSDVRFSGQIVSWKPRRAPGRLDVNAGRGDAWVLVQAQGTIRRLGQGTPPIQSALYRTLSGKTDTDYIPHEYYSWEDGSNATQFASALRGHPPAVPTGAVTFGSAGPVGSQPLVRAGTGFKVALPVAAYTDIGKWGIVFAINVPTEPASTTTLFEVPVSGGTPALWRLSVVPGTPAEVRWQAFNSAGSSVAVTANTMSGVGEDPTEADFFSDRWWMFFASSWQDGATMWATLGFSDGSGNFEGSNGNGVTATHSPISGDITVSIDAQLDGIGLGHFGVYTGSGFDPNFSFADIGGAIAGWPTEKAGPRFTRLCFEEGITGTIVGSSSDTLRMGPQYPDTILNLFGEVARTDAGIIHDTRSSLGLTFRTGRSLYNQ